MPNFMSKQSSIILPRWFWQSVVIGLLIVGFGMMGSGGAIASPVPTQPPVYRLTENTGSSLDIDQAVDKVERAPNEIYEGLERTKQDIGKTEGRKEIIQKARDHASDKWQSLADKARAAQEGDTELSPVDQHTLQHLNESRR